MKTLKVTFTPNKKDNYPGDAEAVEFVKSVIEYHLNERIGYEIVDFNVTTEGSDE